MPDLTSYALIAVAGVLIVFMFLSSRRRRRQAEDQRAKIVPGVEIMTSQGIYGMLISLDPEKNEAIIETTPGTRLRVHSQTIAKVVDEPVADESADEAEILEESGAMLNESSVKPMGEPEYGERTAKPKTTRPRKKAAE
ncbi:MAG: preprotein translocase subunit YajC [Pseudolysinimonas sp.]|uniref:preprotein translocase subunit YajC n=1 Tax=Pseudolysinimonas sp. TaxID=2680009 RepID=UPI003263BD96